MLVNSMRELIGSKKILLAFPMNTPNKPTDYITLNRPIPPLCYARSDGWVFWNLRQHHPAWPIGEG